jgi:hypothetical protein
VCGNSARTVQRSWPWSSSPYACRKLPNGRRPHQCERIKSRRAETFFLSIPILRESVSFARLGRGIAVLGAVASAVAHQPVPKATV